MIRVWLVLVAFVLAMAVAASAANPMASICELRVQSHSGSGTLIAVKGNVALILTARHVALREGEPVRVSWPWGGGQASAGVVAAIVQGSHYDTDMAMVYAIKPKGIEPLKIASFDQREKPWVAAGFRQGVMRVNEIYAADLFDNGLVKLYKPLVGGMSGGPLLDRRGRVVAVNVASNDAFGYCSNGDNLKELLQRFGKRGTDEKQE